MVAARVKSLFKISASSDNTKVVVVVVAVDGVVETVALLLLSVEPISIDGLVDPGADLDEGVEGVSWGP